MNKKLYLFDQNKNRDIIKDTCVYLIDPITKEVIFKKSNKVIIAGSAFTASKHFPDMVIPTRTMTYNDALGLPNTISNTENIPEQICLFSVGTDGCGTDQHQVYAVNYAMWCKPENLVPFRHIDLNTGIDDVDRDLYFGRKENANLNTVSYYFKKFNTTPQWVQRYVSDKRPIESNIYELETTEEIESFAELSLSISTDDCKEFFAATQGIEYTKINTLSLLTAWKTTIDGFTYYQDIRPITKINFPNEPLFDLNKGLDVIYHIYY